ncbi:MAG: SPOR domain-containing protein [Roseovarius sp.]
MPAEFPPASYTGRQYVDSRGCVFIRAGIDGDVTWVPRVTRGRKVICGFQPSLAAGAATAAAAPAQPSGPQPEIITVPKQTVLAPKPAAQPKRVASAPKPVLRKAPKPAAAAPAPEVIVVAPKTVVAPAPAPKQTPVAQTRRVATGQPACQGASAVSQRYLRKKNGLAVRCGPQTTPHATIMSGGAGSGTTIRVVTATGPLPQAAARPASATTHRTTVVHSVSPQNVRVAPRHVYERQVSSTRGVYVPEGYQPVWDDDRLNPRRAHQTFAGMAMTDLIWTRTVPRRLIDRRTGREVTYKYPGLHYPYTSFEQQRAAGVIIATRGEMVPDPVTVVRNRDGSVRTLKRTRKTVSDASRAPTLAPTVSTRSSTAPKAPAKAASHRYVQVGIFSTPDLARNAAQRLANAGLPARMGKTTHQGKPYTSVVVGPFGTQSQLRSGMSAVRRAGYTDAYFRK